MGEETGQGFLSNPESVRHVFILAQVVIGGLVAFFVFKFLGGQGESSFRVREADRLREKEAGGPGKARQPDLLASAKIKKQPKPLQLEGIRIDAPPHQILGVAPDADAATIQKAYRDLMKRYHPDVVGRQGTREWNDAQKIAEAINQAKETLLSRFKKKG